MPGMPKRSVATGPTLRKIDAYLATAAHRWDLLKALLKGKDTLGNLLVSEEVLNKDELEDFYKKWFVDYWGEIIPKNGRPEIITGGFRKALERSFDLPKVCVGETRDAWYQPEDEPPEAPPCEGKPVVTYWVCAGPQFCCYVLESAYQVTLMLLTPPPENETLSSPQGTPDDAFLVGSFKDTHAVKEVADTYPPLGHRPVSPKSLVPAPLARPVFAVELFAEKKFVKPPCGSGAASESGSAPD